MKRFLVPLLLQLGFENHIQASNNQNWTRIGEQVPRWLRGGNELPDLGNFNLQPQRGNLPGNRYSEVKDKSKLFCQRILQARVPYRI